MSGPWENYQDNSGPWAKYAAPPPITQTTPEQSVWGAVGEALKGRPELQPFGAINTPQAPSGPVSGGLEAAKQTLAFPLRSGVTADQLPDVAGQAIAQEGGRAGFPKTAAVAGTGVAISPAILAGYAGLRGTPEIAQTVQDIPDMLTDFADSAKGAANSRWFKAIGGTLRDAKELGGGEAARLGRVAREKGIVTPFNGAESQAASISSQMDKSGKRIGDLRALGDLYGNSPEASKIVQIIQQDIAPKYQTGIKTGEMGDLGKAIEEVLKLEPVDKLTPTEEMVPRLESGTIKNGVPSDVADPFNAITHREFPPSQQYEKFRTFQEDPNYIPEYDLHRPTTFNEVAKVATDLNAHAKGQSKLLQPVGATTDVANTISRLNNEKLLKALPADKGAEYTKELGNYEDLSKMDRINELKSAYETGASRNRIVNNISNRIFHRFGHQLSASAWDAISNVLRTAGRTASTAGGAVSRIATNPGAAVATQQLLQEYMKRRNQ